MIKKLKDYRLKDYELRISKFPPFQRHSLEKGNPPCYTANWIPNQVGNDVKEGTWEGYNEVSDKKRCNEAQF